MSTTLVFAALLGIGLTDNVEARHASLIEVGLQSEEVTGLDLATRRQAESRLTALDQLRPSLGGSVALLAVGAPFFVGGSILAGLGVSYIGFVGTAAGVGALFSGLVPYFLIGVGALFGIIPGAIMLFVGIKTALMRRANVEETRQISNRLEKRDLGSTPIQANFVVPGGMQTMMSF